ncbi:SspB family protein [Chthonobacter albigriseus]|uniref:SspB family protein n=1 Tax=Chthonobacter albigriseus TaxID=1683161 RepID=UPI0015EE493D|nr:ClpXP protease specificity-enhancing factor SspB [Chthonobacter albigriseus]
MAEDLIRYDVLTQEALRGVVRKVLTEVVRAGLPGDHHFYIAFDTGAPGVRISSRLRERFPEEMTIILQHQFWDLAVTEHAFEVGLSFSGVPERLLVPFSAVKGFFDPSVEFGMTFEVAREAEATAAGAEVETLKPAPPALTPVVPVQVKPVDDEAKEAAPPAAEAPPAEGEKSAAVVSLDAFRKKT